ncbi:NAD-dependent succinate-semialdehyde dehydrogenase [Sphingomonas sp. CROZ-RG-20F-R02-07]|uniref:NAD-dependent succinate-semialdehyde dehydrogenase n=1 Tax=Sphingomonas sp. CROZ-RG-20F-R02-07 TaxID=2914832 RepID=UPI001F59CBA0|nr:NAD-dependent succinate-semialdehyde dehydrogenase [Sphingomonas sp. CROZ-RG-20F-R02-07]
MTSQDVTASPGAISRNPATGVVIETYPFLSSRGIEQLLSRAAAAQVEWRATSMDQRVKYYLRLAETFHTDQDRLAKLITDEMGKTLGEAHAEMEKSAAALRWIAESGPAILADEPAAPDVDDEVYVSYLPIGTILAVMPWNLPIWQVVRAAGPIMLSGNGFLLKHAPNVIGCARALQEAYEASGFPAGLFAVLNADNDAVAEVIADRRVAAITLTGSARAGAAVASTAAKNLKKSLLELGGTDAFIVLADADLEKAVQAAIAARYGNAGQVCLAAKRLILEEPIAEAFTQQFIEAAKALKVGDPTDKNTYFGPIARGDLRDGVHDQVQRSIADGATLALGGHKIEGPGFFYEATVLTGVLPGMTCFDEEVFGPVASITIAKDVEDAIRLANMSEYGLGGALWTKDLARARDLVRRIETGGVFVNGYFVTNPRIPVGGVKKSGYGRELSHFGLREFTNAQAVWIKTAA